MGIIRSVAARRRSPRRRRNQLEGRMVKEVFCFVLVLAFAALATSLPWPMPDGQIVLPWAKADWPTGQQANLQIAEDKVKSGLEPGGGMGGMFPGMGGPGGMDLSSFLNNPALMNMVTTMLQDPNMQALMGQMMGGAGGGAPPDMASLQQALQQVAQQMQQSNPELVEQLRSFEYDY